jgi:methyl-accepting chemotaxis protein
VALHFSMKGRLAALAGLALLGLCTLAGLSIGSNQVNQRALTSLYEKDIGSLVHLQRIENSLLEVRFRAAGVLLDQLPVPGSLNHLRDARKEVAGIWADMEPGAAAAFTQGEALEAFTQIKAHWSQVDGTLAKLEQGYATKNKTAISAVLEDDWPVLHKGAIKPLQALIPVTQKSAAAAYEGAIAFSRTLLTIGLATAVVCLLGLAWVAWLTMRALLNPLREVELSMRRIAGGDLATPMPAARHDEVGHMIAALGEMQQRLQALVTDVRRSTESITTASTEIAAGSQDLSSRTEQAASNLQQAASSMEQLTGTVRQSASSARQANELASSAAAVASHGGQVVADVVTTMGEINASSKKIADIIGVIDTIAFQTNILALNAAVEAARAGEQGRGFAVVASEVRGLAQRSAAAAREIKGLIDTSVDKVELGSKMVANAGATMQEIVASVQRVNDIIVEISASASEQSDGIGQVNHTVTQLDQMTQQNAALVEQSAAAAESLKDQAHHLSHMVATFKLEPARA